MKLDLQKEFGSRLVKLHSGVMGLRSMLPVEAKAVEGQPAVISIVASDATLDRYDEVIDPTGWDLKNYLRNPVIVNSHQYWDIGFMLGCALETVVKDGKLCQKIQFAVDINPVAKMAYELYRQKFLNAFSVGFSPVEWVNGTNGSGYARKYLKQELLENSCVIVPANPNALQDALTEGALTKSDLAEANAYLRGLMERIEKFSANPPAKTGAEPRAGSSGLDAAQLAEVAQLARATANAVKKA